MPAPKRPAKGIAPKDALKDIITQIADNVRYIFGEDKNMGAGSAQTQKTRPGFDPRWLNAVKGKSDPAKPGSNLRHLAKEKASLVSKGGKRKKKKSYAGEG